MSKHLTYSDTKKQSLQVFGQFGEKTWIPNAKINAELTRKNANELKNIGLGKVLVLAAMGESLEDHIETIKKYRDKIDLMVCDKAYAVMMEHGIKPDYCMVCDANIPFRHIEKYIDTTEGTKLIATPYANPEWTKGWKGERYFYVNKDSIESENIFLPIMGKDSRVIPASTNVSNAMLVFMMGYDEKARINFTAYEKFILTGYDYSWRPEGNYYAFNNPKPKRYYMKHMTLLDMNKDYVYSSHNLVFSARWLYDYIMYHRPPVINCSGRGILDIPFKGKLEDEMIKLSEIKNKTKLIRDAYKLFQTSTLNYQQTQNYFEDARRTLWQ